MKGKEEREKKEERHAILGDLYLASGARIILVDLVGATRKRQMGPYQCKREPPLSYMEKSATNLTVVLYPL